MSNKKSTTKKALFSSIVSLLLCFTMLIGTTFAWFTDTVTSSGNRIQAGTLQVGMEYREPGDAGWTDVEGEEVEPIFSFENIEPGYTMLRDVKISNNGSLAIQWQLNIVPQPDPEAPSTNYDLADVIDVYFAIIDEDAQKPDSFADAKTTMTYVGTLADLIADADGAAYGVLLPENGSDDFDETEAVAAGAETGSVVGRIALHMQETAGNDYQGLSIGAAFDLQLLATQFTYENDSFDNDYDANAEYPIVVNTREEAQEALDNATEGAVIQLTEKVDYGVLYLRQSALSQSVDMAGNWAGGGDYNRFRSIKDVTIVGAPGATVERIAIEAATYTPNSNSHSNSADMPYLQSYIKIENLTIKDVTFDLTGTDGQAINLSNKVSVDGLTIDHCTMTDDGDSRLLFKSGTIDKYYDEDGKLILTTDVKNIAITNCTVVGAYMVVELRESENITISGNTFTNIVDRNILLPHNKDAEYYTGNINITNNISNGLGERFIRMDAIDAKVTITGNTISGYNGPDDDVIKITNITGAYTIEGNTFDGQPLEGNRITIE